MSNAISKGKTYKQLIARMDAATESGFYLEAAWIAYAILEDRIDSALIKTGGNLGADRKKMRMLGNKVTVLKQRYASHPELTQSLIDKAISEIDSWKESRNAMMHSMANEAKPFDEINRNAEKLAVDGSAVARSLCDAVTRLKRIQKRALK